MALLCVSLLADPTVGAWTNTQLCSQGTLAFTSDFISHEVLVTTAFMESVSLCGNVSRVFCHLFVTDSAWSVASDKDNSYLG